MSNPAISILMPVYNGEKHVSEAIQSILDQSFQDFEIVIINDGSKDRTVEIISSFKDPRIKLLHNSENLKIVKSLNKGLLECRGEFIARMDCDDLCEKERLEVQYKFMKENPEIGICGTFQKFFGDFRLRRKNPTATSNEEIHSRLLFGPTMLHPTVMFRASVLHQNGLSYDENYHYCEDYEMWVRASNFTKLENIPQYLCRYRWDGKKAWTVDLDNLMKGLRNIWLRQLEKLGLNSPSEEELKIHALLGGRSGELSISMLFEAVDYLKKLATLNKKNHTYNEEIFLNELRRTWILLCRRTAKKNPLTMPIFIFSKIISKFIQPKD
ncbi:MAG: glycosyltransferase family 2 protein [Bacteriovorax sp.]